MNATRIGRDLMRIEYGSGDMRHQSTAYRSKQHTRRFAAASIEQALTIGRAVLVSVSNGRATISNAWRSFDPRSQSGTQTYCRVVLKIEFCRTVDGALSSSSIASVRPSTPSRASGARDGDECPAYATFG